MALQPHYGESFDLVSNITKRKVSAMEYFMKGQYEDILRVHGKADEWIFFARREAVEQTRQTVMRNYNAVRPDGKRTPVSAEFYVQYILRRMWFICCRDQCGMAFQDIPAVPIKLMNTDENAEGPRAPEHIREMQSKEEREQHGNERTERVEEKAITLSNSGLEERLGREIKELTAAHLREVQDLKAQMVLEIRELKNSLGKLQGDDDPTMRQD